MELLRFVRTRERAEHNIDKRSIIQGVPHPFAREEIGSLTMSMTEWGKEGAGNRLRLFFTRSMIFLREKTFLLEPAIALLAVFLLKGRGEDVKLFNGPRLFYFMSREEKRERQKVCRYRYRIFPGYFA